jgi:putative ABC transport system permease protein
MEGLAHSKEDKWLESNYFTYLVLAEGTDVNEFETKMPAIIKKYMGPQVAQLGMTLKNFRKAEMKLVFLYNPLQTFICSLILQHQVN